MSKNKKTNEKPIKTEKQTSQASTNNTTKNAEISGYSKHFTSKKGNVFYAEDYGHIVWPFYNRKKVA